MKVNLIIGKVWTYVKTEDESAHRIIDNTLSVLAPHRFFVKSFKMKLWDGKKRFYDLIRQRFLTGFLSLVQKNLKQRGYIIEILDNNILPKPIEITEDVILNGVDKERWEKVQLPVLKELLREGRGILRMATSSGKTEVMAGIAKVMHDKKILILVHRVELLKQTVERLENRLCEKIGQITANDIQIERVNVGMVMSVWSKRQELRKYLKEIDVVINDETHRASSNIWSKVLQVVDARWRFGMSGTPLKGDDVRDMTLIGLTGGIIEGHTVVDLVEAGYAVLPIVTLVNTTHILGKYDENDGNNQYTEDALFNVIWVKEDEKRSLGKKTIAWIESKYMIDIPFIAIGKTIVIKIEDCEKLVLTRKGKPYNQVYNSVYGDIKLWELLKNLLFNKKGVIIFTERVNICLELTQFLQRNGFNTGATYGGLEDDKRIQVLKDLKDKKIDVLVCTTVIDEGIDVSNISCIVFMTSNKSIVRILQRIGRGVRIEDGKDNVEIIDFIIDAPYLKKHILHRVKLYKTEQFRLEIV